MVLTQSHITSDNRLINKGKNRLCNLSVRGTIGSVSESGLICCTNITNPIILRSSIAVCKQLETCARFSME